MPGSHSKKDKLKKNVRKARKTVVRDRTNEGYEPFKLKGKKRIPPSRVSPQAEITSRSYPTSDYQNKVEYEQDKELGEDAVSITETNAKKWAKQKKRIAKVRKADQQDINRVKRWDSRSFNKKKERAGTTEPVFFIEKSREIQLNKQKGTYPASDLSGKPMPGMKGDELMANLRNRIARGKKEKTNFGVTLKEKDKFLRRREEPVRDSHPKTPLLKEVPFGPRPGGGEYVDTYGKDLQEELKQRARHEVTKPHIKIRPKKPTQKQRVRIIQARLAKIRKANGGVAPNYNNPSKVRKKKSATKAAARSAVNKGVNKVNPIKPTKTYKDTINIKEEDPDRIKQNATTIGRGNPSHFGKTKKRIARIRKATEQIDPRVKKRKTVRPDSPVQRVAYNPPDRPKTHPTRALSTEMKLLPKSKSKLPLKKRVELLRGKKTKPVAESSVIDKESHLSGGGFSY